MTLLAARTSRLVHPSIRPHVGDFISPRGWQQLGATPVWAADNDAFSGFDPDRYRRMLDRILAGMRQRGGEQPPMFVTVPDAVGDWDATLELYQDWHAEVGGRGLPRALVLQNGVEACLERHGFNALWWDDFEALFIGGDTAFKFSEAVREIVRFAKRQGKWVHMGRVNSIRRMEYARMIGCDSCDGSGMARFPSTVLVPMAKALSQNQLFLF